MSPVQERYPSSVPPYAQYGELFRSSNGRFKADSATSAYGKPIAIVFGTQRISGTIILSGNYQHSITAYNTISQTLSQIALCEGEIDSVLAIWREQTVNTPAGLSVTIATGTNPQTPWSWLTSNGFTSLALGYGGVATASCESGHSTVSTGELQRSTFEVKGLAAINQDGTSTAYDTGSTIVINSLLTNAVYGLAWDASLIQNDSNPIGPFDLGPDGTFASSYAAYCYSNGFFISIAIAEQRPTRDIIEEILTATDGVAVWSEGQLKIIALGEEGAGSGINEYVPAFAPWYDLGYSAPGADFIAGPGEPLVTLERAKRADTYNCFPVEFSNRFPSRKDTTGATISEPFNAYNADVEDGFPDPVDVEAVGLRKADPVVLRCITRPAHALAISKLLVKRALYTERNTYRFRLGWRFALLEPTDLVTITDAALGLSRQLVRITEIEEQDDGTFDVTATEVGTISVAEAATYTVT